DHAEIVALKRAGGKARGATLYLTLEPCSHYGRTPPCVDAVIRAGIREVVCGTRDPNPLVAGRGFRQLRRAGVIVRSGILEPQCRMLIESFAKFITQRLPFVTLKLAASLDGKIAVASGDARWISGAESRRAVHGLRNRLDAVVIGSGTLKADDPQLTCRIEGGRNPWRVVLDSRLSISLSAQILHQKDPDKTIIVSTAGAPAAKARAIEALGSRVWRFPAGRGGVSWFPVLRKLAAMGVVNVLIEGGAKVAASALQEKVVDKVIFFYAPKIIGGDGFAMIGDLGIRRVRQALELEDLRFAKSGKDLLVTGYLRRAKSPRR
ncbi:MAG TPA: bifunctional diaminohydroxyphosphoribosylaminopyrimidine deaminase/5-amino-6-(5-phosphoribosylamino)uracil reductase RibD, partial [Phototrophicaceae bacterium]|nr:bifunctional diaminohydroxyphosphoribosylaminopyrimidine deaminase/5-amino-6-(5-phosphoribosylamino)uracil reductase RibD [Phototrophicaceae bacterium]